MSEAPAETLNVYIGCEPPQHVAAQVLKHSILSHARVPVRVRGLDECAATVEMALAGRTMFSLQRFLIPQLNGRRGLAVYLDSDMLVFRDIGEMLECRDTEVAVSSAMATPDSGRKPQYSVLVIDCARAVWDLAAVQAAARDDYRALMTRLSLEPSKSACLPYQWNSLERLDPDTGLLHYTSMNHQPWVATSNPLLGIWMDALFRAMAAGYVDLAEVRKAVKQGWVRPGLLWQAEQGERDPRRMPMKLRLQDYLYTPPHQRGRRAWRREQARLALFGPARQGYRT